MKIVREENPTGHLTQNQSYQRGCPRVFPLSDSWITSAISQTIGSACVCSNVWTGFVRRRDRLHPAASVSS